MRVRPGDERDVDARRAPGGPPADPGECAGGVRPARRPDAARGPTGSGRPRTWRCRRHDGTPRGPCRCPPKDGGIRATAPRSRRLPRPRGRRRRTDAAVPRSPVRVWPTSWPRRWTPSGTPRAGRPGRGPTTRSGVPPGLTCADAARGPPSFGGREGCVIFSSSPGRRGCPGVWRGIGWGGCPPAGLVG